MTLLTPSFIYGTCVVVRVKLERCSMLICGSPMSSIAICTTEEPTPTGNRQQATGDIALAMIPTCTFGSPSK